MDTNYNFDTDGVNKYVNKEIQSLGNLSGKTALDCPAGDGRTSFQLLNMGATVTSADLFPKFCRLENHNCDFVNLNKGLSYPDESFDYIVCQEGIEHFQDQISVLQELARVLKPGGQLILTTPNISHLRAKISHLFNESDYLKRTAPSELDSVWFTDDDSSELYFGHIFLINAQKLRSLGELSGLEITKIIKTDIGTTSLLLLPILYPLIVLFNLMPFLFYVKKLKHIRVDLRKSVMKTQFKMNCSLKLLLSKHLMVTMTKTRNKEDNLTYLKQITRGKND